MSGVCDGEGVVSEAFGGGTGVPGEAAGVGGDEMGAAGEGGGVAAGGMIVSVAAACSE